MTNKALAAALVAILVVLPASAARAQTEASKPAGITVEQGKPARAEGGTKPMKTAAATGRRPLRMYEDARHCLDLSSTAEIVKCAEPYRY
ncbi:MAG: hypothetical protein OEO84_01890 [Betaproteobacteria bacterium]|nr:hypothetical protein [Betaproteobacteria bacterium]